MFSPRSANYDKLEGGMGPSRLTKRFGWKRFAIGAGVLIGLVWAFGPRYSSDSPDDSQLGYTRPSPTNVELEPLLPPIEPVRPPAAPTSEGKLPTAAKFPTSYETDPDHAATAHCKTKHATAARLVQYALMIDAGSTGSRIHVYKFHNCGPSPEYEYEVFMQTKPGLSSYAGHPEDAAQSLDVLLDEALRVVPQSLRACTPVAVKATAGLRLTGKKESADILDAVRSRLSTKYPFPITAKDGVVIMDGSDEGVYAWITANYLLDTIRATTRANTQSYAVLDLGGASTQIVFEPKFSKPDSSLVEGDHKYDLLFGGHKHVLYQHSYLGYGLMRARKHVHQLVDFMSTIRPSATAGDTGKIGNPCLARGTERVINLGDRNVTMTGSDVGSFDACNRIVELVMAKDAICETKPCSFDGVYQPSLMDTFPTGNVLLLSYFYDRLSPILPTGTGSPPITVGTIGTLAKTICLGESSWKKHWGKSPAVMEDLAGRPEWCLDMTFMHALLRLGYELEPSREVHIGKQIEGTELGWCLGATIAMVGGELTCRV